MRNKDYLPVIQLASKPYQKYIYYNMFCDSTLDKDNLIELFKVVYYYSYDNNMFFTIKQMEEILNKLYTEEVRQNIYTHISKYYKTENHMVTIYRGVGNLSAPFERALSWTLDLDVAKKFSRGNNSKIYVAKVLLRNIKDIALHLKEEEVIVLPQDVLYMKEL